MNTKKFFQILAVSATALITACEERLTSLDSDTPITVTSQVSEKTRAGYDNANLPSAFVMDINQGSEGYNYSLVTMSRGEGNSNAYSAPDGTLLLWRGTDHSGANIKAMTIPNGLDEIDPQDPMTIKVNTNQTTDANVKASDLLGAQTGDGINIDGDNINIEFRHLLSKLYINYEFSTDLTSRNAVVNSITLKSICVQGGYSYKDMNYVNSSLELGDIQMYHNANGKAAEAIFYPHTPDSKLSLEVTITVRGTRKTLTCPIELKSGKSFEGRKQYTMNIKINGTTIDNAYITTVKDWISDSGSMTNKKILWTGTSIPAGETVNNYPNIIADATGYTIINNALPGSFLYFDTSIKIPWTTSTEVTDINNYVHTYSLAGTPEEMKARWYDELKAIQEKEGLSIEILNAWMDFIYSSSYVNRILPYINGEKDNCNVLILDFGFNDRLHIAMECNGHRMNDSEVPNGINWLESLIAGTTQYSDDFQFGLKSYFVCMERIINACKAANPNLKIIIGNYFAQSVPLFDNSNYGMAAVGGAESAKLITKANEAVAAMHGLDIVNVYKYTGLDDESSHGLYNTLVPDGIHPHTDPLGRLNRIIANVYLEEFRRIFGEE